MRFKALETSAEYFVRELPDGTVAWVGESVTRPGRPKEAANVFVGRRVGDTQVRGDLVDIPKGRASGIFDEIQVTTGPSGMRFELPGVGRRTLVASDTEPRGTDFREWGCGFYDEAPDSTSFSLTGVWSCNDGGHYYVRQVGNRVVWFGEHPSGGWANVFMGELTADEFAGKWIDVPKGTAAGSGAIRLRITGVAPLAALIHGTRLERVSTSGSFGGSEWHKTDSVRLAFRLRRIHIVRNADVGGLNRGGDEPYLMPIYITIGGNQYTELAQLTDPRTSARPLVVSPLFQHEWGTSGDWPKNNITWQEDLAPGTRRPVPEYLSYAETELRTLPGLQPNSATARESSLFFPGIIAMEEASTRNDDIRAGYNALLATASGVIHAEIQRSAARFSRPDIDEIAKRLKSIMKKAIESSVKSDLFGLLAGFDPDKQMGQDFTGHSLGALRDAALRGAPSIPVEMAFTGGADGLWQISGTISASIGPLEFSTARVSQLEVTFETGGDNKEAGSAVALTVGLRDGRSRGPFPAHAPAQKFHDGTLHTTMVPLDPPAELGSLRELRINWTRQPGDGLFRQPDSWNLRSLRIVAFDVHNRRHVLRRRRTANLRFDGNGSVTILLAGG